MVDVEDPENLQNFINHIEEDPTIQQFSVNAK